MRKKLISTVLVILYCALSFAADLPAAKKFLEPFAGIQKPSTVRYQIKSAAGNVEDVALSAFRGLAPEFKDATVVRYTLEKAKDISNMWVYKANMQHPIIGGFFAWVFVRNDNDVWYCYEFAVGNDDKTVGNLRFFRAYIMANYDE